VALALTGRTAGPWMSLRARLASERDLVSLPCPFTSPTDLLAWLEENRADILLLDEQFLRVLDSSTRRRLRAGCRDLRVLVLCEHVCTSLADEILRNGFRGLLQSDRSADSCVKAVRAVCRGELWLSRGLLEELLKRQDAAEVWRPATDAQAKLTRREAEAVAYLRRGLSNKQIGRALGVKEDTVKKHLRNTYAKLGVHRRSEIMVSG